MAITMGGPRRAGPPGEITGKAVSISNLNVALTEGVLHRGREAARLHVHREDGRGRRDRDNRHHGRRGRRGRTGYGLSCFRTAMEKWCPGGALATPPDPHRMAIGKIMVGHYQLSLVIRRPPLGGNRLWETLNSLWSKLTLVAVLWSMVYLVSGYCSLVSLPPVCPPQRPQNQPQNHATPQVPSRPGASFFADVPGVLATFVIRRHRIRQK